LSLQAIYRLSFREKISGYLTNQPKHEAKGRATNDKCCFNHIMGLPEKNRIQKPLFDYEGLLYAIILRETLNWMSLSKTTKSEG
jgi:hypothetical protein